MVDKVIKWGMSHLTVLAMEILGSTLVENQGLPVLFFCQADGELSYTDHQETGTR